MNSQLIFVCLILVTLRGKRNMSIRVIRWTCKRFVLSHRRDTRIFIRTVFWYRRIPICMRKFPRGWEFTVVPPSRWTENSDGNCSAYPSSIVSMQCSLDSTKRNSRKSWCDTRNTGTKKRKNPPNPENEKVSSFFFPQLNIILFPNNQFFFCPEKVFLFCQIINTFHFWQIIA